MAELYLAGGCLWGVQHFLSSLPGVTFTEAGRANGRTQTLEEPYDGYAECVYTVYDQDHLSMENLLTEFFAIIDPYAINQQGPDVGPKYRTGIYSEDPAVLVQAQAFIDAREDADQIAVEVLPLSNYIPSADLHQNHLERWPEDHYLCAIPDALLNKFR